MIIYTGQQDLQEIISAIDGYTEAKPVMLSIGNLSPLKRTIDSYMKKRQLEILDRATPSERQSGVSSLKDGNWEFSIDGWTLKDIFPKEYIKSSRDEVVELLEGRFVDLFWKAVKDVTIEKLLLQEAFEQSCIDMSEYFSFRKERLNKEVHGKVSHFIGESNIWKSDPEGKRIVEKIIEIIKDRYQKLGEIENTLLVDSLTKDNIIDYIDKLKASRDWSNMFFATYSKVENKLPSLSPEEIFTKFPIYYKDMEHIYQIMKNNAEIHCNGFKISGEGKIEVLDGISHYVLEIKGCDKSVDLTPIAKILNSQRVRSDGIRYIKELVCKRYGGRFLMLSNSNCLISTSATDKPSLVQCQKKYHGYDEYTGLLYRIEFPKYVRA